MNMKVDLYTKAMLTIIALSLAWLCLKNEKVVPTAQANDLNTVLSPKEHYGLIPLNEDGSINVHFTSADVIDVNLKKIGGSGLYSKTLSVKLEN